MEWEAFGKLVRGETNPQHSRIELVPINNKKEQLLSKKVRARCKNVLQGICIAGIGVQLE